ncbi:MAG: lysophospholipid acyltransferase family protein [Archangium sp.]|nr:lysophospholipid acyltransferase family protein [Archangium sp.]MDP3153608.1 lysophospholipid acyltransferase family protein [Archangium sp.]MDP3569324.1 lysophospholipid acyltransferase family protein [Archangium sp.]
MITDAKSPVLTWGLGQYVEWKLRSAFRGIWLEGALPDGDDGVICYANHTSFWDGFLAHLLARRAGRDGYAVMEEQNLQRYRFLTRIGAFSIRRGDSQSALQTFRHARTLLRRPKAAVFIFPQGKIEANAVPPLKFERGTEVLARMARVRCVPVALRYAFFENEYPDVVVKVGEAHAPTPLTEMESRLGALVGELQAVKDVGSLQPLVRGRRSVAEQWDAVRGLP